MRVLLTPIRLVALPSDPTDSLVFCYVTLRYVYRIFRYYYYYYYYLILGKLEIGDRLRKENRNKKK